MLFEDTLPIQGATSSALTNGQWFWSSNVMYYKPSSGTPLNHTVSWMQKYPQSTPNVQNGIDVSNQSYVTITNIEVIDANYGVNAYETTAQSNNITVKNCSFIYNLAGVQFFILTGSSNGNLSNNYYYRDAEGPTLETQGNLAAPFNSFTMNGNTLVDVGTINGTVTWDAATNSSYDQEGFGAQNINNSTISHNTIKGGVQLPIVIWNNGSAVSSTNIIGYNSIAGVTYSSLTGSGLISLGGGTSSGYSNNRIIYNLITNSTSQYCIGIAQGSAASQQNIIANNDIVGNNCDPIVISSSSSVYLTFKNNLLYNNSGSSTYFTGIYNVAVPNATFIADYNLYPSSATFGSSNTNKTWAQWQALGCDTHGIVGNPLFTNGSGSYSLTTDFTLQPDSPAIGAGTNVGLTTDFAGNPVPSVSDIGAYEFLVPITPPTGLHIGN